MLVSTYTGYNAVQEFFGLGNSSPIIKVVLILILKGYIVIKYGKSCD